MGRSDPVDLVTVGHGTLPAEAFTDLLRSAGIELLVDVRSYPGSRRNPQFGREQMADRLPAQGVGYRWEPRLGGRRRAQPESRHTALRNESFRAYADYMESDEFAAGLNDLLADAARVHTAVMCAESVWWRCHRRLVADAVVLLRGGTVHHLMHDGRLMEHPVTDGARRDGAHVVYDSGQDVALPM